MKYSYNLNQYLKLSLDEKLKTYLSEKQAFEMSREFKDDEVIDAYMILKNDVIFDDNIPNFFLRKSALNILKNAIDEFKAMGFKIKIYELYRSFSKQKKEFDEISDIMQKKYPNLKDEDLWEKITEFIADPSLSPPHCTGGALDITLVRDGLEIDMGTKVNEISSKSNLISTDITKEQQENRKMLYSIMIKCGFAPIASEWWHFSYGDMYWACFYNKKIKYDVIDM